MRIAYLAPAWPSSGAANGIVTYVTTMRRQLLAEGHDVCVIAQNRLYASDGAEHALEPGEDHGSLWQRACRRIDLRRGDHPLAAMRLGRQLRRARAIIPFDLAEMEESFGWSRTVQRALDVPVVTRLHGPEFQKTDIPQGPLARKQIRQRISAEGRAIHRATALSAPTAATLASARHHYGARLQGAAIIPNPVETHAEAAAWRANRDAGLILFVGRFDYQKGANTMLQAFALLAPDHADLRLIMVGPETGLPLPDGRLLSASDYAEWHLRPEVRQRVIFTGTLTPGEILKIRKRASVTVVASRQESFCFAVVEAMAAACPVISTAWNGSADVIDHGRTGWLTPVGEADQLARRIAWVVAHPDLAEQVGAAGWEHCRQAYSPEAVSRRSIDFYTATLDRHAARR